MAVLGSLLVGIALTLGFAADPVPGLARYALPIPLLGLVWGLIQRGHSEWAGRLFIALGWLLLMGIAGISGGIAAPGLPVAAALVVLAGLVYGEQSAWMLGVITMFACGCLFVLNLVGVLPPPPVLPTERYLLANIILLGLTTLLITRGLRVQRHLASSERAARGRLAAEAQRMDSLEIQLHEAQRLEAIGRLAGGIAHDFNNLLMVLRGNLSLFVDMMPDDDAAQQCLQDAIMATQQGERLTSQLLAYSRRGNLQASAVDPSAVLDRTCRLLRRTLDAPIQVEWEPPARPLWPCQVDVSMLEAALLNLALNARDAMPQGGVLRFRCSNHSQDQPSLDLTKGRFLCFQVEDTGEGMSDEVLAHAFEPFFTTKERGRGTGLGLAMVFGFAKQSGGHVQAHRRSEGGTTFHLWLPAASPDTPLSASPTTAPRVRGEGQGELVLIVEDEQAVQRVVARALQRAGYRAATADSAEEALELLTGTMPDLLLTDVVLPDRDGHSLIAQVATAHPDLPVILMSGYHEDALIHREEAVRPYRLLAKPFDLTELAGVVRAALDE